MSAPRTGRSPLADRMRPTALDAVIGQAGLTGPGRILHAALETDSIPSMILWGPPGCGKTTLARVIAAQTRHRFQAISAVFSGVRDLRAIVEQARGENGNETGTILFVDEIHRFNKAQQDAFLPFVETGVIVLIGATTENPSFSLNNALLSRCRVVVLDALVNEDIIALLERAATDPVNGYGDSGIGIDAEVFKRIADRAEGDGRYALNALETVVELLGARAQAENRSLGVADLEQSLAQRAPLYDRDGDGHYNLISALHKSLRGSDVDAALYWLARMLAGGEEGLYIARRLIRFASEDVGNADPQALALTMSAREVYHLLGSPEGELALAQAVVYLASAPKSNSVYVAFKAAQKAARNSGHLAPPAHILNAPTALMKELGYGRGYRYAHDYEAGFVAQEYLPDALRGVRFYQPVERGFEREIARRLKYWARLRGEAAGSGGGSKGGADGREEGE